MFLVVGLGNPGEEYMFTRHNVGFMFADFLADALNFPGFKAKFSSLYAEKNVDTANERIIIQKPQTFMNASGQAVGQISSFYKLHTKNVIVIHDDIDLNPLDVKIRFGGSNGGHNGLRSIDSTIGKEYWKIRVGVGRPQFKEQVSDYVLSRFGKSELKALPPLFDMVVDKLFEILNEEK